MKNNLTLLYVEDNEIVRENFTMIFSQYFEHILTASNGIDALEIYEKNASVIDIAILDITIPHMSGLELAEHIRKEDKDTEIIMLTGHYEKDKLLVAVNLHLFCYLVKPVKKDELKDSLTRLLTKIEKKHTLQLKANYSFNTKSENLYYKNRLIKLSKNEKKLISYLASNMDDHHNACSISDHIFNKPVDDELCNNVVQLISRFKKKMLDLYDRDSFFIDNIYGLGYKIV